MEHQFERTDAEFENRNSINKKRRGGRPKLSASEKKRWSIRPGFSDSQFEKIVQLAETAGLSEAEFIRRTVLNVKITSLSQVNKDALVLLNRISNNVNQIAISTHVNPRQSQIESAINTMRDQLNKLAEQIVS
jgi:PP-loop superfamily ATP-utilizing enzyme